MTNLGVVKTFEDLQNLVAQPDDFAYCEADSQIYEYFDEGLGKSFGWRIKKIDRDKLINLGITEYELNKIAIAGLPSLITEAQLKPGKKLLHDYMINNGYFMLLCNDIHYYTVLAKHFDTDELAEDVVIELLTDKGSIQSINFNADKTAVECWIKNEEGCFMFLLFNYDWGVIPCR